MWGPHERESRNNRIYNVFYDIRYYRVYQLVGEEESCHLPHMCGVHMRAKVGIIGYIMYFMISGIIGYTWPWWISPLMCYWVTTWAWVDLVM